MFCETCGVEIIRAFTMHERSVFHKNSQRIRILINEDCITLNDIAKRVGVSRERVRQIAAKYCAVSGHERQRVCTLNRQIKKATFLSEVMEKLDACGIPYETVTRRVGIRSKFLLAGKPLRSCILKKTSKVKARLTSYIDIKRPRTYADFSIYKTDQGFLVIPYAKWPKAETRISLRRIGNYGNHSTRHDWADYLEAWPLLIEQSVLTKVPA